MAKIRHITLSLGNQAYQEMKRIILKRQIPPGGKLNEGELAKTLGISRTPVREAINRLEKEGLVEIFPQRGAFVVQFSEKDVYELFLIRENLEGLAAYLAAAKMNERHQAKLNSCVQGFEEPFSEEDTRRYAREDFKFHQTIVAISEARRLINLISTLHDHIRMFRLTTIGLSGRMKASLAEHRQILAALEKRDPEESEQRMRQHIRNVRDGVMANINFFLSNGGNDHPTGRRKSNATV
ncbi:MAG: GntR family transcriptional regulator [Deltaproteobacteria bacterium]|nr:GntR family transcriptional regulator [Deltaproteobacteria bacterium]